MESPRSFEPLRALDTSASASVSSGRESVSGADAVSDCNSSACSRTAAVVSSSWMETSVPLSGSSIISYFLL